MASFIAVALMFAAMFAVVHSVIHDQRVIVAYTDTVFVAGAGTDSAIVSAVDSLADIVRQTRVRVAKLERRGSAKAPVTEQMFYDPHYQMDAALRAQARARHHGEDE